ncbi:bifunctional glycosyltransferase/CDP-glycerol:glycerophosphate glycerophosphotransferase [Bacillus vallismortis]|uniref:bifunctional glycosyltransferase/CDP-glycerol:glycerophosphate glycerophosphotransferase n=1 Tax=Bacillus vallismortis TaxID=72361 RepID=UPI00209086C7|nr:CDP-glycerol glycerophosphotransferase family protein [Bacillus vallismortis]MCO4852875.1 CDP-glycerol glycerophosphotransferase family protein [Bacillus vallismortis]
MENSKNNYEISVIVPIYNVGDILSETLNSLLNQTFKSVEYILIDDGSTDNSPILMKEFADKQDHVQIISQTNKGPAAARNRGLENAKGKYICFVDSDDILPADSLETLYTYARKHGSDLVTGASKRFNSKKEWYIKSHVKHNLMKSGLKTIDKNPELFYSIGPCAKLYKKSLLKGVLFSEDLRFGEDQPVVLHAYLNAKNIYTINQVVYLYRLREGDTASLTQEINLKPVEILDSLLRMISTTEAIFSKYNGPSNFLKTKYLERVLSYEIWGALNGALLTKDSSIQRKTFNMLNRWIEQLDTALFNNLLFTVNDVFFDRLTKKALLIKPNSKKEYIKLMSTLLAKINLDQTNLITIKNYNSIDFSIQTNTLYSVYKKSFYTLVKKHINKKRIKNFLLKRIVFKISNALPKTNTISLATNNSKVLQGNLLAIYKGTKKFYPDKKINIFLGKERTFTELIYLYYKLGRSKWIFIDDYYYQLYGLNANKNTEIVQTWHAGGAFKKFGFSALSYRESNSYDFEKKAHSSYTKVLVSSPNVINEYSEAFNADINKIIPLGIPRTDIFYSEPYKISVAEKFYEKYPELKGQKIILYAPTFRGNASQRQRFNLKLDLDHLREHLNAEYTILLKLHPSTKETISDIDSYNFIFDMSHEDIDVLMIVSNLLVTDYSSVIFEYSILRRPIIFFAFDLEDYLSERGFYFDYKSNLPGPIAENTPELAEIIKQNKFDLQKISNFCNYYIRGNQGTTTRRVLNEIFQDH